MLHLSNIFILYKMWRKTDNRATHKSNGLVVSARHSEGLGD